MDSLKTDGKPKDALNFHEYSAVVSSNRFYLESLGSLLDVDLTEENKKMSHKRAVSISATSRALEIARQTIQSNSFKELQTGKSPLPSPISTVLTKQLCS